MFKDIYSSRSVNITSEYYKGDIYRLTLNSICNYFIVQLYFQSLHHFIVIILLINSTVIPYIYRILVKNKFYMTHTNMYLHINVQCGISIHHMYVIYIYICAYMCACAYPEVLIVYLRD